MSTKRNSLLTVLLVLSVSTMVAGLITIFLSYYFSQKQYQMLGIFCESIIGKYPESEQTILEILREQEENTLSLSSNNILYSFGYGKSDFIYLNSDVIWRAIIGLLIGISLFVLTFAMWNRRSKYRIRRLTEYLEKVNLGKQGLLLDASEDEFSRLQDEIYKTITTLYQTRDAAVEAKRYFADNLYNIAHQLKTPITAISLSTQMMKRELDSDYPLQIEKQIYRLTYLEEALLLLARIDAGTLIMKEDIIDVFTVLSLAADNLQELYFEKGIFIDIPEKEEISIKADLEWTMEAMMNLLKNCMEHSAEGTTIHCSYERNLLYTEIKILDEGKGFEKEDLPHLFERFYRGKYEKESGVGIGLSLSRAIIEMQNGIISAYNLPQGGACFDIRFYSH